VFCSSIERAVLAYESAPRRFPVTVHEAICPLGASLKPAVVFRVQLFRSAARKLHDKRTMPTRRRANHSPGTPASLASTERAHRGVTDNDASCWVANQQLQTRGPSAAMQRELRH
jgi:hypothetical protein